MITIKTHLILMTFAVFVLLVLPSHYAHGQNSLDIRLGELSEKIANKMSQQKKTKIAVLEFSDLRGNITDVGRFMAEELVTRLTATEKFIVVERQLLAKIVSEQKLGLTGIVDPASAKQLGKILGVDALASGTITELSQMLRVNARLISAQTGEVFAVAATDLPIDESIQKLIKSNRGITRPTSSNEDYNQETSSEECEQLKTGDFCFTNLSNKKLRVSLAGRSLTLESGQTQCFYNLKSGAYGYTIGEVQSILALAKGEIFVEQCKSKTFEIK